MVNLPIWPMPQKVQVEYVCMYSCVLNSSGETVYYKNSDMASIKNSTEHDTVIYVILRAARY